eukprot:10253003-Alexandrium_andersonii.AAC.1
MTYSSATTSPPGYDFVILERTEHQGGEPGPSVKKRPVTQEKCHRIESSDSEPDEVLVDADDRSRSQEQT